MTDFHKQVEAIVMQFGNYQSTRDTQVVKMVADFTALVQTLVPEEKKFQDENGSRGDFRRAGFNQCRTQILSTIKGVKADE